MILLIHIALALASLGLASYSYFRPSTAKLRSSYSLAAGTLSSGILLIIVNHASIVRTCLSGIIFFGIIAILNETARRKLALESTR